MLKPSAPSSLTLYAFFILTSASYSPELLGKDGEADSLLKPPERTQSVLKFLTYKISVVLSCYICDNLL